VDKHKYIQPGAAPCSPAGVRSGLTPQAQGCPGCRKRENPVEGSRN
jgi:hypothetical protein